MGDQKNLLLAILASLVVLLGFQLLFPTEEIPNNNITQEKDESFAPEPEAIAEMPKARNEIISESERIKINNKYIEGSITLTGARIDDIILKNYLTDLSSNSDKVKYLSPKGSSDSYFAEYGWVSTNNNIKLPDANSIWTSNKNTISTNSPVVLSWDNGNGLIFKRTINIDEQYMFSIEQTIINNTSEEISLYPYGLLNRSGFPKLSGLFILHEGPIGVLNDRVKELDYDDLEEEKKISEKSNTGWLGITDKYWLAALIPDQNFQFEGFFQSFNQSENIKFQTSYLGPKISVTPNSERNYSSRFYTGAKELPILDKHEKNGIPMFDKAIDFGWFYVITKPLAYLLNFFSSYLGNVGLAIIALTICIRIILFPLANKSFKSMSKMKVLQPKMMEIRERYGNDKVQMQKEVMALYKKEKANPLAGCLPILLQIPVFFALYKVLTVTLEMRQAPFYGWIKDLSVPDPYSIFNLFGLIPIDLPSFLIIGIWPLLMGGTMFLQQKLNPAPPDPVQAKVMAMLPLIFIFLFAQFAAGLVLYWTCNNVLSIAQQWIIMRKLDNEKQEK
ncbi:MAG: Membrane protein insertase YidC [Alphaproteobacteria bacterium MarineAlpha9_Bin3]|nr:MAG: Membrane protein insertase YidC [Alphaproteobacteria bacterium MarineAlpha9_Bin3]|tara:strand:- start:19202 stop:20884 length:1683 start_codon:yes stop_codon:yes gene_type:complete